MVGITFRIKYNETIVATRFARLEIKTADFKRVVKWGTRRYDAKEEN